MKRILVLIISILLPLLLMIHYYNYDETNVTFNAQCGFHHLTGLQCPGCGGQRAFHYLLHGEVLKSLRYNVLLIVSIPVLFFLYYSIVQAYGLKNQKYINHPFFSTKFVVIMLITLVVFFIIRNIPYSPFIYLSPPASNYSF